ncbi:MAG: thiamine biosynthesis protein [Candidatus Marinimicrobia bacterium]|nr:thiamine biosynthesis protein [Candidatus Neomarinimicrobiota bacterium]
MAKKVKAIGLLSGGLDSVLACALIRQQGIEVTGLLIRTGFTDHKEVSADGKRSVEDTAKALGVKFRVENIQDEYWDTLLYPKYGYGKNVNPCLDCHLHMIHVAARVMEEEGADFVFTGEVMGQRPKSQLAHQMKIALNESGLEGKLLRPLSALCLEPTIPELEGLVDRTKLKGFQGRGRTPQLQLAKELGVEDLAVAAGGNCYLIVPEYGDRFKDLLKQYGKDNFPKEDAPLLRIGRHFRISEIAKMVISRDESEYHLLQPYIAGRYFFELENVIGGIGIGTGEFSQEDMKLAAQLLARYSKAKQDEEVLVHVRLNEKTWNIKCTALSVDDPLVSHMRI